MSILVPWIIFLIGARLPAVPVVWVVFSEVEARLLAVAWEASSVEALVSLCAHLLAYDQDSHAAMLASMPDLSGWKPSMPSFGGFGSTPTTAAPDPLSSPEWPSDAGE